jgi:ribosomal protein L21E
MSHTGWVTVPLAGTRVTVSPLNYRYAGWTGIVLGILPDSYGTGHIVAVSFDGSDSIVNFKPEELKAGLQS